ncbi:hypothetical protein R82526_01125 [Ralstonia mannitolilytica]|uniref:glycosyltransferase family 87 protein n=1 Tax=Ralstonia mannitolilytica TaxID=105219 RepID=UPI0007AFE757|nr:glycosyltransferase family 87 protein [Ralstonia mannitolilytica]ANA34090.1 membrane protein [Ralstonia mannitolilytica]CAJ0681218.1 hypothetical protein R82526_01125 [Ralstonia mannitolilytica]CAJ0879619.1 hypothetical protein R76727_03211 [Ralstonia mannitolilytica]
MSQRSAHLPATCTDAVRQDGHAHWLDLARVRAYSGAFLILFGAFLLSWGWVTKGFTDTAVSRPGTDFAVFWSASHLALSQGPLQAYDAHSLAEVMAEYGPLAAGSTVVLPWLYPPTFLLVVMPLSLISLAASYLLFLIGTGYVYFRSISTLLATHGFWRRGAWLPVLASPATLITALMGQNSLLTAGLAASAVYCVDRRPIIAGVLIGLLAIKPQLAMLFPLALIAVRAWRALLSAAVTAAVFFALSVAVCGWETVPAFMEKTQWVRAHYIEDGAAVWYGMATPLAAARLAGASIPVAYAAHTVTALAGAVAMGFVWSRTPEVGLRVAAVAIATMLAIPYLRCYELTWLCIALAGVVGYGIRHGLSGAERGLLVLAWLLPLYEQANPYLKLPQIGPLVLAAMMLLIVSRVARRG